MIRLLLDQGLPRTACRLLADAGWDAIHVGDLGLSRATDQQILDFALSDNRVCVTLDADFHALLATANASGPSVVRIRKEGLQSSALAELLIAVWPQIEKQVIAGAMITITEKSIRVRGLPVAGKQIEQP